MESCLVPSSLELCPRGTVVLLAIALVEGSFVDDGSSALPRGERIVFDDALDAGFVFVFLPFLRGEAVRCVAVEVHETPVPVVIGITLILPEHWKLDTI